MQELCIDAAKKEANPKDGCEVFDRLKFSWKHQERERILSDLKECNSTLKKLGSASHHAKPYERKQQVRRVHASFKLREEAERLYQIICKTCSCQPCQTRNVGLGLTVHHRPGSTSSEEVCFRLILFDSSNNICAASVKMLKAADTCEPPKKKVRTVIPSTFTAPSVDAGRKKLQHICQAGRIVQQSRTLVELTVDEKDQLYTVQKKTPTTATHTDSMMSLTQVMESFKLHDRKRWLHHEKAILAVVLAHSLPQVHESSWWQSLWDSNNISFLGTSAVAAAQQNPDQRIKLWKPFTMSPISYNNVLPGSTTVPRKNAHLHALGIVLLEIYLNQSVQPSASAQNQPGLDRRNLALDLLEEHSDDHNMTPECLSAMQFCLSPRPNPYSGSFSF